MSENKTAVQILTSKNTIKFYCGVSKQHLLFISYWLANTLGVKMKWE